MAKRSIRVRCVVVAVGLTVAVWGAAAVLAHAVGPSVPRSADEALVRLCLVALLAALGWGWLQGLVAVAEAWSGSAAGPRPRAVRRLVLAACGAAALGVLVGPAAEAAPSQPGPDDLAGLPLPERAVGPAHVIGRADGRSVGPTVVVRRGDTLWTLAAAELGPQAGAGDVAARWQLIYRRNRAVIGADPDLIRPGQLLRLPHLTTREPT